MICHRVGNKGSEVGPNLATVRALGYGASPIPA
jgi:hypothetical protein